MPSWRELPKYPRTNGSPAITSYKPTTTFALRLLLPFFALTCLNNESAEPRAWLPIRISKFRGGRNDDPGSIRLQKRLPEQTAEHLDGAEYELSSPAALFPDICLAVVLH